MEAREIMRCIEHTGADKRPGIADAARRELRTIEAENAKLRDALKPFAIHADYFYHSKADNESALTNMLCDVVHTVSVGAFKQAKAALSQDDKPPHDEATA